MARATGRTIIADLRSLRKRREANEAREEKWAEDTVAVLKRCREEGFPITDAADEIGLERSTLYRTYLPKVDGEAA